MMQALRATGLLRPEQERREGVLSTPPHLQLVNRRRAVETRIPPY
jgi:hypothetical protein